MIPRSDLLMGKQLTNIARLCKFACNACNLINRETKSIKSPGSSKSLVLITRCYMNYGRYNMCHTIEHFTASHITTMKNNILSKPQIIRIYHVLSKHNVPFELIQEIYKLIINRELYGII